MKSLRNGFLSLVLVTMLVSCGSTTPATMHEWPKFEPVQKIEKIERQEGYLDVVEVQVGQLRQAVAEGEAYDALTAHFNTTARVANQVVAVGVALEGENQVLRREVGFMRGISAGVGTAAVLSLVLNGIFILVK